MRFAMEVWHQAGWKSASGTPYEQDGWTRMDHGSGGSTWKPRRTAIDAVHKCLEWTGLIGIPTMQVVDLATGDVVWRWGCDNPEVSDEARAGPWVLPLWHRQVRAAVRADRRRSADPQTQPHQQALW
jgi:hypothetical protein